jgi:cardiolipin synthase (CMP-forming)
MKLQHLPNAISIARLSLVVPITLWLLDGQYKPALWLFLLAGASDALDGFFARRFGWQTRVGALLDPAADKVLLVAAFFTLGWLGLVPWWLVWTVFARDVIIVALYWHRHAPVSASPTTISKLNTLAQTVCVLLVVYGAAVGANRVLIDSWLAVTLLTTVFSGLLYLWLWARRESRLRGVA